MHRMLKWVGLTILAALLCFAHTDVHAQVLLDVDMTSPLDLLRFRVMQAGKLSPAEPYGGQSLTLPIGPMIIDGVQKYPVFLYNGGNAAWNGLAYDMSPEELPKSGVLRLTVWLKTNCAWTSEFHLTHPDAGGCRVFMTEGSLVGQSMMKRAFAKMHNTQERQVVVAELGRFNPRDGFSFGIAVEYNMAGGWVLIDRFRVECVDAEAAVGIDRMTSEATCTDYELPSAAIGASGRVAHIFRAKEK